MIKGSSFTLLLVRLATGKLKFLLSSLPAKMIDRNLTDFNLVDAKLVELWEVKVNTSSDSYLKLATGAGQHGLIEAATTTHWNRRVQMNIEYQVDKAVVHLNLEQMWWNSLKDKFHISELNQIDVTQLVQYFKLNKYLKSQTSKM